MDEALYSATYVDNYIDSVENLPHDVQLYLSRIRDIDVQYRKLLREVDHYYDLWRTLQNCSEANAPRLMRSVNRIQQNLIQAQELGDEKMKIVNQLQELIDFKTRQLDVDQKNLDIKDEKEDIMPAHLDDNNSINIPQKQTRTQSPSRFNEQNVLPAAFSNSNGGSSHNNAIGLVSGNSSTSYDKNNSNSAANNNSANGNATGSNIVGSTSDNQRANKRSRRRHDTSGNMDVGGNESNSASEAFNGERNTGQKSNTNSTQRKNSLQGQANSSGNLGNVGNSCGSSNATSSASGVNNTNAGKKKKRKARGGQSSHANAREDTPPPDPIDPDEPTYCVCNQISFGEMILCDNDLCPIEWFHFSCVSLVLKPKGKWYCPNCRGDRPNVMKPKAQFLKELVRYNKEKEEKT